MSASNTADSASPGRAPRALLARGNACLDAGDFVQARALLAQALGDAPDDPQALFLHGLALHGLGQVDAALASLRQAAVVAPREAPILNALGSVLADRGDHDDAIATLRRACELAPGFAPAWFNLGKCLSLRGATAESEAPLRRAVALAPQLASARFLLGEALMMLGRVDDAAEQYRALLRQDPRSGLAWWGLANLKALRFGQADIEPLQQLVRRRDVAFDDHLAARFALAKALDDVDRPAEAFAAYVEANAVARPRFAWQAAGFDAWIAQVVAAFDAAVPVIDDDFGSDALFIVGLPRSASTLTEQILAAHPAVEGASELSDLGVVIAEESRRRGQGLVHWAGVASQADWRRLGEQYLQRTAHWRMQRPRFTDKMPGNWVYTAAIRRMLPGARIVHCRRDAVETCWSCFRQIFWSAHDYSYDLDDLAAYWRTCDATMRRWQADFPTHLREQVYEDLLADTAGQTRALLDFCGLPFDPACLQPHQAARSVRTASAAQVREPLRRDTARTARYGALLDPLRQALQAASPR